MNNIDLATLTNEELESLKRAVGAEVRGRKAVLDKAEINDMFYDRMSEKIHERHENDIPAIEMAVDAAMKKAIVSVLDLTLKNYECKEGEVFVKKSGNTPVNMIKIYRNGSKVVGVDPDKYKEMATKLIDIIEEYF